MFRQTFCLRPTLGMAKNKKNINLEKQYLGFWTKWLCWDIHKLLESKSHFWYKLVLVYPCIMNGGLFVSGMNKDLRSLPGLFLATNLGSRAMGGHCTGLAVQVPLKVRCLGSGGVGKTGGRWGGKSEWNGRGLDEGRWQQSVCCLLMLAKTRKVSHMWLWSVASCAVRAKVEEGKIKKKKEIGNQVSSEGKDI